MNYEFICPYCDEEGIVAIKDDFIAPSDVIIDTECAVCGAQLQIEIKSDFIFRENEVWANHCEISTRACANSFIERMLQHIFKIFKKRGV